MLRRFLTLLSYSYRMHIPEMETGRVDRHRSGRPAGRVAGRVEIFRLAGQAG